MWGWSLRLLIAFSVSIYIIYYLLENSHFTLDSMCFRQLIGIFIESDPAHLMANLFLSCYERKRLLQTKKRDMRKAGIFSNIFRIIDDLCSFSDDELFFSIWVFFSRTFKNHRATRDGEGHFFNSSLHPLHRHLGIGRAIAAGSSPLRIANSRTRTGNL